MNDKLKKLIPLTRIVIPVSIIIVLGIISIIGYSMEKKGEPIRVLFKTQGGNVVFDHKNHQNFASGCNDCHHGRELSTENYSCRKCHNPQVFPSICEDKAPHKLCIAVNCIECHKKQIGKDESECTICHKQ